MTPKKKHDSRVRVIPDKMKNAGSNVAVNLQNISGTYAKAIQSVGEDLRNINANAIKKASRVVLQARDPTRQVADGSKSYRNLNSSPTGYRIDAHAHVHAHDDRARRVLESAGDVDGAFAAPRQDTPTRTRPDPRAVVFLVETSDSKKPKDDTLGGSMKVHKML
jgi:hypothetical protein